MHWRKRVSDTYELEQRLEKISRALADVRDGL